MDFTKPSRALADLLQRKMYRNPLRYGTWDHHDRPANQALNVDFDVEPNTIVWTCNARTEEDRARLPWLGTVVGVPRTTWWEKYRAALELEPLTDQRVLFWATLRPTAAFPMLAPVMAVIPAHYVQGTALRVINLSEQDPEKRRRMNVAELHANTVGWRQVEYYGNVGLHSLIAAHHGLVNMRKDRV